MLVYNSAPANPATTVDAASNADFFAQVARELQDPGPTILLVGGSDFASWTVRAQQAPIRFDRRPSDYSHAALICEWNKQRPEDSWGLEIDPVYVAAARQFPEHGGVTPFRLGDYQDTQQFPNVAIIDVPVDAERNRAVVAAACTPMRDPIRFPLLRWLASWRAFITLPEVVPHPLLNRTPHPGAAFVAMAYEAADVTLIPGATDLQHCPELLWANAKYWGSAVGDDVQVFRALRDRDARTPAARSLPIPVPQAARDRASR